MSVLAGERKGMQISRSTLEVKEQRDGTVVRVLASHQCGGVQINAIHGLSLLLVLSFAPRGFSVGTPVFPSPQNQHFQILIQPGTKSHYVDVLPPDHYLFIYLFRGEEQGCAIVAPGLYPLGLLHCKIIFDLVHTYLDIFEYGEYFLL